jgi:hypothetical protein
MWLLASKKCTNCIFWNAFSNIFFLTYQNTRCHNPEDTAQVKRAEKQTLHRLCLLESAFTYGEIFLFVTHHPTRKQAVSHDGR